MSETISREEFVKRLSESGLLPEVDLRAALDGLGRPAVPSDAGALATSLVDSGHLTSFQADAILAGQVPRLFLGNYSILDRLGAGGMGTVFKARHRSMKRIVALKLLSRDPSAPGDHARRFQREVETIAQLSHPNIVMAYDAGEAEDGLYLVMEYVDGRDLANEVARSGPLSVADAVDCVVQTARGLACAHEHGIVHRDVKPANLLRAGSGVVKVADLGLAQRGLTASTSIADTSLTQAGTVLGTADYIAPEQALDSAHIDHRVDIYSLGCTLFFLLAGRPMYTARSLMALLLKHRDAPIPSLAEAREGVPAGLEETYRRMVAKRPDDRYPTMAEVVRALERVKGAGSLPGGRPGVGGMSPRDVSSTDVTMEVDSGATIDSVEFRMNVPVSGEGAPPTNSDVRRVSDLTVVLVEPSQFQARIARDLLRELGIEDVLGATSGRQALALARREGTNVVLSAMHLADMTGAELAQALRDDPGGSGVGFVLASSEGDGASPLPAAPLTVWLRKPFDLGRLAQALAQASGRIGEEIHS